MLAAKETMPELGHFVYFLVGKKLLALELSFQQCSLPEPWLIISIDPFN